MRGGRRGDALRLQGDAQRLRAFRWRLGIALASVSGRYRRRLVGAHPSIRSGLRTKLCKLYKVYKICVVRRRVRMGCGEGAGGCVEVAEGCLDGADRSVGGLEKR